MYRHCWSMILFSLVAGAAPAHADQAAPAWDEPPRPTRAFVEGYGNWGVNLGRTDYVPDGRPGTSKHPFANGFGGGATVGVTIVPAWLSLIVDYRYGHTSTRKGSIDGVLTRAEGSTNYNAITAGLRIEHRRGRSSMYGQMHFGVLLPFHTTLEFEYAPPLAAIGITGEGTREENFNVAYGAQAELGFRVDLVDRLYAGAGIRIATFQATNAGKETELENFVVDFTAVPPVPVTTTIHHGTNGPATPTTYSIQDVRLNVAIGYRF